MRQFEKFWLSLEALESSFSGSDHKVVQQSEGLAVPRKRCLVRNLQHAHSTSLVLTGIGFLLMAFLLSAWDVVIFVFLPVFDFFVFERQHRHILRHVHKDRVHCAMLPYQLDPCDTLSTRSWRVHHSYSNDAMVS